jgi:hypothetical protein
MSSSESESSDSESSGMPMFKDGDNIIIYKVPMQVYLEDKGLVDFLEPHPGLPKSFDGNMNKVTDKKVRKLLRKNRQTLMILSQSLADDSVFCHYRDGMTKAYPKGLAWPVWQNLMDEYDLTDGVVSHQLRLRLHKLTMKQDEDPYKLAKAIWSLKQDSIETKAPISDAEAVSHFVNQLPKFYMFTVVRHTKRKCKPRKRQ